MMMNLVGGGGGVGGGDKGSVMECVKKVFIGGVKS